MPNSRSVVAADGSCSRCNETHTGCRGHSKQTGKACGRPPIASGVCRYHGGSAGQVKAADAERKVIAAATGMLSKYGEPKAVSDPLHSLLMIGGRCEKLVEMLNDKVDELTTIRYENAAGGEQLRAELSAYMTVLDRCRATLVDILKLDIWDRLAKVEERQVQLLAEALDKGMTEAGIEPEKAVEVKGNVARHLRVAAS